jgi:hypothetical protein
MWIVLGMLPFLDIPSPAPACILCTKMVGGAPQPTLRQDLEQAKLVVYGTIANPRFAAQGPPGTGTTELHIVRVFKDDTRLNLPKVIELPRYLPVPDPRDPPKFVIFCEVRDGKLDPNRGRAVTSPALLDYLAGIKALSGMDRLQNLQFYFRNLDHADEAIATDAFLEFARCNDQEIGQIARQLSPARLRKLLQDSRTPADRLGLFAFLLGGCGDNQDADFLEKQIKQPSERVVNALDGYLSGYVLMRPRQGWDLAVNILADARKPFPERYSSVRLMKFYHNWKPAEFRPEMLRAFQVMLADGEIADLAMEDLRTWQWWDLTPQVLAQYGKPSHTAPIVRRAIVRYALCCPRPEARQFVETVRMQDRELVRDLEESLELDRRK